MAYTDNKAASRASNTATTEDLKASNKTASPQEKSQSVPRRTVARPTTTKYEVGPNTRVRSNGKGTDEVKVPTTIALGSKKQVKPATNNPDGQVNRFPSSGYTGNKAAAKKY
jgi:hypothetical protein